MKIIKSASTAVITTIDESAKLVSDGAPLVRSILCNSAAYLNDTVKSSRREALIESINESDEAFLALTKDQQASIDAAMSAY